MLEINGVQIPENSGNISFRGNEITTAKIKDVIVWEKTSNPIWSGSSIDNNGAGLYASGNVCKLSWGGQMGGDITYNAGAFAGISIISFDYDGSTNSFALFGSGTTIIGIARGGKNSYFIGGLAYNKDTKKFNGTLKMVIEFDGYDGRGEINELYLISQSDGGIQYKFVYIDPAGSITDTGSVIYLR
ncbi:MAG: hypothetical protein LBD84_07085 [Campylobacteraceae bacterium]|nr:hypothetical protein [Campylobacteraceae bacterium]